MKTMSKKDFDRLSKKKGFKVKLKKNGKKKLPESVTKPAVPLSGEMVAKAPAPASPELIAILERMTDVVEKLGTPSKVEPEVKVPGVLSIAAAESAKTKQELDVVAIFEKAAAEASDVAKAAAAAAAVVIPEPASEHRIVRSTKKGTITEIHSLSKDGEILYTHEFTRSEKNDLLTSIRSVSEDGVEVEHLIHRDNQQLISEVVSTPVSKTLN